ASRSTVASATDGRSTSASPRRSAASSRPSASRRAPRRRRSAGSRARAAAASVGRGTFVAERPAPREPAAPVAPPSLSPLALRVLDLERARPRFGSSDGAVPLHTLSPDPSLYPPDDFPRV